jgi:hypothetical protein
MQASRLAVAGLAVMAGLAATMPAKAATTGNMSMKPLVLVVSLGCSAAQGDVARTITITNTSHSAIPRGTRIGWIMGRATGVVQLQAALAVGKTATGLGPPGNGGTCRASYVP